MDNALYLAQRGTGALLAPLVIVHALVILFAVHGGLTAEEILGRTQGSWFWAAFYGLFVIAVAVHGAIGLRNIVLEATPATAPVANILAFLALVALAGLGLHAVGAVT